MWPFKSYNCRKCKDTGVIVVEIPVPIEEQTTAQRGYIMAFGGRVVREEERPCPQCQASSA